MLFDTDTYEKIVIQRINFSGEAMKILLEDGKEFNREQSEIICLMLGVPYRTIREDEKFLEIDPTLLHGRLNLEFDNNILSEITME